MMARRPRAPVLAQDGLVGDGLQGLALEVQLHAVEFEEALVLLHQRVARLDQDLEQGLAVQVVDRGDARGGGR